jgi:hypothetical protein
MLADWYFCACVKADPDKTAIFLQILESLADAKENPELAVIGLGELQRLDPWMRAYALPAVLRALDENKPASGLKSELDRYFSGLLRLLPQKASVPFERLVSNVCFVDGSGELLEALHGCLASLNKSRLGPSSLAPYLDLQDFLSETFILAVLADRLERDGSFSSFLSDTDQVAQMFDLIDLALDCRAGSPRLGRLAFRCALTVARLGPRRHEMRWLEDAVWNASPGPELEPDLLSSWSDLIAADLLPDRTAAIDFLIGESISLAQLRNRLSHRSKGWVGNPVLPQPTDDVGIPLAIVFWQSTLWERVVRLAPEHAAERLSRLWCAPQSHSEELVEVKVPFPDAACRKIFGSLLHLLRLRDERLLWIWKVRLFVAPAEELVLPPSAWLIFSPWLQINRNHQVLFKKLKEVPRYPGTQKMAALVRLMASAHLAGRLLFALTLDDPNRPVFGSLLVHAADVLESLGLPSGVPGHHTIPPHPFLTTTYLGLAIYLRRHVEQLGTCIDRRLRPEDFLESPVRWKNEHEGQNSEPALYERIIVPSVLISWVTTAYLSATRRGPSTRWLSWVEELYARQGDRDLYHHKLRAEVMARFLAPHLSRRRAEIFDWRNSLEDPEQKIWQRQILISPPDLTAPDWDRQDLDAAPKDDSTKIAIALERFAALENRGNLPEGTYEKWRSHWTDLLVAVNDAMVLDRFVRLRLLELFDSPLLRNAHQESFPDGRELIALTLLEYGSVYELERLFERLYPDEESSWQQSADRATSDLRVNLIYALARQIGREAEEQQSRLTPQDIFLGRDFLDRELLCRETLQKIAYFHRPGSKPVSERVSERIRQVFRNLTEESVIREAEGLQLVEADLATEGHRTLAILPPQSEPLAEWRIRSAARDPNLAKAKFVVADTPSNEIRDLFTLSRHEVDEVLRRRQPTVVLAIAVKCEPAVGESSERRWKVWFNCGLGRYVTATLPLSFERGDLVSLPIIWLGTNKWPNNWFPGPHRIEPLRTVMRPGVFREVWLGESRPRFQKFSSLSLGGAPAVNYKVSLDDWCGNPAWIFRGENVESNERKQVWARLDGEQIWRPRERHLAELLLSETAFGSDGVAVLAWLGFQEILDCWRFAVRPGEIYLLSPNDFAGSDGDRLGQEIERQADPRGLLVAVTAECVQGTVRLSLARLPPADPRYLSWYPELEIPFDRRNISWRCLVQRNMSLIAHRSDRRWIVHLEGSPPGFPKQAQVWWDGRWPAQEDQDAEISAPGWDPWQAEVKGELVQTRRLLLSNNESQKEFVRKWLGLRPGDFVPLLRAIASTPDKGGLFCCTPHGIPVFVDPESLSMRLLPKDQRLESLTRSNKQRVEGARLEEEELRIAELVDHPWAKSLQLEVEVGQVSRDILERGAAEGVLVEVPLRSENTASRCEIWWWIGDRVLEGPLQVFNFGKIANSLRIGARIRLEKRSDGWSCEAQPFGGRLRALWKIEEWSKPVAGLTFLGNIAIGMKLAPVAESRPGRLVVLPGLSSEPHHLAEGDGLSFRGGLADRQKARTSAPPWLERQGSRRMNLSLGEGILCGDTRADRTSGSVLVSQVRYRLEHRRDDFYDIRRWFLLTADLSRRIVPIEVAPAWLVKLEQYFEAPYDLEGTLKQDRRCVTLLDLRVLRNDQSWTPDVPLADDEAPYVSSANYSPENVRVRLIRNPESGRIVASFRQVPPLSIERFYSDLGTPNLKRLVPLQNRLYYAGPEFHQPGSEEQDHRFEWGYGLTLVASESRLRFNGTHFSKGQTILFYGDRIVGVTFLSPFEDSGPEDMGGATEEEPTDGPFSEASEDLGLILLSIDQFQLDFSESTVLYKQAAQYRLVHLLNLHERAEGIDIRSILGMEERSTEAHQRPFRVERARLDSASEMRLRNRGAYNISRVEDEPEGWIVLGRLDLDRFRSSFGLEVVFHHVRLSFVPEENGNGKPMRSGELVFLRTKRILPLRNDFALELEGWDGLDPRDLGPDCASVLMLRRQFSVREDLLPRIYEANGGKEIEGSVFLVYLIQRHSGPSAMLLDSSSPKGPQA